jgi:drug/metabolite transporter (DMT)-like permease
MSEATTGKPDRRRWSYATGCICGLLCGIAGTVLGRYLGDSLDARLIARLRADGHTFESPLRLFSLALMVGGACLGWLVGWLLTAFLPRKRLRTRGDYFLILVVGLLPLCMLIALLIFGMAVRHGSSHRTIRHTPVSNRSAPLSNPEANLGQCLNLMRFTA